MGLAEDIAKWSRRERERPRATPVLRMRRQVLVHPGDDWAPNLTGDRVSVALHVQLDRLNAHVSIWGADDMGVERCPLSLADGIDLYLRVASNTCPPLRSLLTRWGFRGV